MATYSYQSPSRALVRMTIADNEVHRLIAIWTQVWLDGGGLLNDFRRNDEPANLNVTVTSDDEYATSFEMKIDGLPVALFDVFKAPLHGRIRVRSAPHSAPYSLSEDGEIRREGERRR